MHVFTNIQLYIDPLKVNVLHLVVQCTKVHGITSALGGDRDRHNPRFQYFQYHFNNEPEPPDKTLHIFCVATVQSIDGSEVKEYKMQSACELANFIFHI